MDEILERFKQEKYKKCLELINKQEFSDNLAGNFMLKNNWLICNSVISILEKDECKKKQINEEFKLLYKNVTLIGLPPTFLPLELKLSVIFNFSWWLLFNNNKCMDKAMCEEYLALINSGLCSVLGKNPANEPVYLKTTERIVENLCMLKGLTFKQSPKIILIIIELVVTVMAHIIVLTKKYTNQCIKVADLYLADTVKMVESFDCLNKFSTVMKESCYLFKFGLNKITTLLSEVDSTSIDYLLLLKCTLLYTSNNHKESLKTLQARSKFDFPLLNYLGAISSLQSGKGNLCLEFLNGTDIINLRKNLKIRFLILRGKLCSLNGHHKEAISHFTEALDICNICPLLYFYIGHEWGKMGLNDIMAQNFEKLLKVIVENHHDEINVNVNFDSLILDWIHPYDEITEREALYALAISHGLNERYCEAASTFERLLQCSVEAVEGESDRIVNIPHSLTILHDASITNLLAGDLVKAEEIAISACMRYQPQEYLEKKKNSKLNLLGRNTEWLVRTIEIELLEEGSPGLSEDFTTDFYPEELVYLLPENVIGLLIMSEVQRIQKSREEYMTTLRKIFSLLSNYLGNLVKKEVTLETNKRVTDLIKALAAKTCLAIAKIQIDSKNITNTEKMFKRSLSCNKGDKDVLATYCKFLIEVGKKKEASKLWNTFSGEKSIILVESVQSLSLRYFLMTKVTTGEIEKIQEKFFSIEIQ